MSVVRNTTAAPMSDALGQKSISIAAEVETAE
jgi:hypothetical protein